MAGLPGGHGSSEWQIRESTTCKILRSRSSGTFEAFTFRRRLAAGFVVGLATTRDALGRLPAQPDMAVV